MGGIREDKVDVKYMDLQGVERRVGAKTRFEDVKKARVLRITRRVPNTMDGLFRQPSEEKAGLMPVGSKRKKKRPTAKSVPLSLAGADDESEDGEGLENEDHSVVGMPEVCEAIVDLLPEVCEVDADKPAATSAA